MTASRTWTIFIAQDKHLDYNWCGTQTEIEVRMAALVDGYLALAEEDRSIWNLDSTLWYETYKRQRGPEGAQRLARELRRGTIGFAANHSVLLWGLLSTELAIQSFYQSLAIDKQTGIRSDTALIMENPGMMWGVAGVMTACGLPYLARGIYDLRAEGYNSKRQPYPLFWWLAPDGKRVLVHWDLYTTTGAWGGYAEAYRLAELAGENWDALNIQTPGDRNTFAVYDQRVEYIDQTVKRYEAYGEDFPVSSILLLGTGWDNWTITDDLAIFIRRFNAESDGSVRLVDARYRDYFEVVEQELTEKALTIPTLTGTFGISWEEWTAHLAGPTRDFRQASRLLVHAQAQYALNCLKGEINEKSKAALDQGIQACLRFAEHDFGGVDLRTSAISAGVRAGAAMEANAIACALSPVQEHVPAALAGETTEEDTNFNWRGWQVHFDPDRSAVVSLRDLQNHEWIAQNSVLGLGTFLHARYHEEQLRNAVLPNSLQHNQRAIQGDFSCRRAANGVEIKTSGWRWGFAVNTRWFFHAEHPWIDMFFDLAEGWTQDPQTVQFCFPFTLTDPVYTYDMAGSVLQAGGVDIGGDDLPGANPVLYALQNFAQIHTEAGGAVRSVTLLSPDAPLVQFGASPVNMGGADLGDIPSAIISMPMMNLTRTDWSFNQGGDHRWQFRYRLIVSHQLKVDKAGNPIRPLKEAQHFAVPPFLQMPGDPPVDPQLADLCVNFEGGPVTAFKCAEDGERLILRVWNVQDHPVTGSTKLPRSYKSAEITDALERHLSNAEVVEGAVRFTAPAASLLTLAFLK